MNIQYVDRKTGIVCRENTYFGRALSLLYADHWLSKMISLVFFPFIAKNPYFSKFYGYIQNLPISKLWIDSFVKKFNVDLREFEEKTYRSFNDFFIRKLKPDIRKIDDHPKKAIMPADGRYLVFPKIGLLKNFIIKGSTFDLASFLVKSDLFERYKEGSMVIARLCPSDYHRFHFFTDGFLINRFQVPGFLASVNPLALRKMCSILWSNKREISEYRSDSFGNFLYVEIGATCVGTIHQTYQEGMQAYKGDEKGYFSFGGSCIVLVFEKDRIVFDSDLVLNSEKGIETKGYFGDSLGTAY